MTYIVRDAQGTRLGVLPDSLPDAGETRERFSPAGSRAAPVPAGEHWETPPYLPGTHALEVFLDGLTCVAGEADAAQYAETGTPGAPSGAIVFHFDINTDCDVLVRVRR